MLILLDIDGVMVPASGWKAPELLSDGFPNFSMKAVKSLKRIIHETGASIILTSSHKSSYSELKWKRIFAIRGIEASIRKLKSDKSSKDRKEEVLNWVKANKREDNFIIIDDDKSLNDLPSQIKQRLILTSPLIGLNESLVEKAIEAFHPDSEKVA